MDFRAHTSNDDCCQQTSDLKRMGALRTYLERQTSGPSRQAVVVFNIQVAKPEWMVEVHRRNVILVVVLEDPFLNLFSTLNRSHLVLWIMLRDFESIENIIPSALRDAVETKRFTVAMIQQVPWYVSRGLEI